MAKSKWLDEQPNGGARSTTWRGGPAHTIKSGDVMAKSALLATLKKQAGLPSNHVFNAPKEK